MISNTIINVTIVEDSQIKDLNKKHLGIDDVTDVLSFNMNEEKPDGTYYLGDIIVNKDQAKRQASKYNNTYEQEIAQLVEHGVLHLLGVHHDDDDKNSIHGIPVK